MDPIDDYVIMNTSKQQIAITVMRLVMHKSMANVLQCSTDECRLHTFNSHSVLLVAYTDYYSVMLLNTALLQHHSKRIPRSVVVVSISRIKMLRHVVIKSILDANVMLQEC